DISDMSYAKLISDEMKTKTGEITFVTATDGNHGRGIAWTASRIRQNAVVYMPKGSAQERLENIRKLGAHAEITELNYDDTVRFAQKQADEKGWVLVQDTAWEDYEEIPLCIMQGYMTMANEAVQQLGETKPTHIFLQAGVGAMSGALTAFFRNIYGFEPKIVIVELEKADCIYRTASADDGKLHTVTGDLDTIMAGLACGEPCTIGWELLKYGADAFISAEDTAAAYGMRILGNPDDSDDRVISGESGAATFGALCEILRSNKEMKEKLGLNEDSVVLCFSTEGATDTENYRNIVWDGLYNR
ncbi:MAG: diaminopropionate ammonia-lyase, partial [Oscillospiraceae bacterium]|nr:diaminopropionate ammonia-lyase [Oscillospiraceae bacterium]